MKIFTLSAICVLVYGLLVALSGITSFPGYSSERDELTRQQVTSLFDAPVAVSVSPAAQEWEAARAALDGADEDAGGRQGKDTMVRLLGVMFILVWIYVSVRLLSAD